MSGEYATTSDGMNYLKPDGSHLAKQRKNGDVVDELNKLLRERDAARAECERLRKALERIAGEECYEACPYTLPKRTKWFRDIAAAALSPKESSNG